ncbi:MAG: FliI/YscN family ATPase [Oligoflexia bacterium]|nr:FliI/YscN family ATPase [Oligoflexia bacterium]
MKQSYVIQGELISTRGPVVKARLPMAQLGDLCHLELGNRRIPAQVLALHADTVILAPFDDFSGIKMGAAVFNSLKPPSIFIPEKPCGCVLDAFGRPMNSVGADCKIELPLSSPPPRPLSRTPIATPLHTGVKVIDGLLPLGIGQRTGIFASAGCGKSTLLSMLARNTTADLIVVGLVGERGREVQEFIQHGLGEDGLRRCVVVVSTSDESALRRMYAPYTATAIAEHYRAAGKHVLLLIDSLTRTARAIRDVGLAAGEMPVRAGLTSAVFTELPRLLERAGTAEKGAISAIYSVLTADAHDPDPLADEIKSLLDGHIVLSPELAVRGRWPAIDLTRSISRLALTLLDRETECCRRSILKMNQRLERERDMITLGGKPDRELERMLNLEPQLHNFASQPLDRAYSRDETLKQMQDLVKDLAWPSDKK